MLYLVLGALALGAFYFYYFSVHRLTATQQRDVKGKVVVCIGSTTGFGGQFVLKCLENGMTVFAGCHSPGGVDEVRRKCATLAGEVFPFHIDIQSRESIAEAVTYVGKNLKDGQGVGVLMCNAGVVCTGMDDWVTPDDYDNTWRLNALGLISTVHAFKEKVKAARGRIIITSSICGRIALPGFGPYTVTKYALEGYADTIRRELRPFGVKVSLVEPGFFKTPITTPHNITGGFDKAWQKTSERTRQEYGEEFHRKQNALYTKMLLSPMNSNHPEHVVEAYYHAATSSCPKARYVVGIDANLFYVPLARLPAVVQDAVCCFTHWLVGYPKPAIRKQ